MSLTVTVRTRPGQPTVWLEVAYDGLEPPRALFADLEMIGWRPPVPASPPRSAIDWSTPNPCTGERFTIRNWRVEGQIIEPPAGSGPRGAWTAAERWAFLRAADGVLRRHGVYALAAEAGSPAAPPASAPAARTDPAALATPPPPTNPAPPVETRTTAPATEPAERGSEHGGSEAVIVVVIEPTRRAIVTAAVAELGLEAAWSPATLTVRYRYRGSEYEAESPAHRVELRVPADAAADVARAVAAVAGVSLDDPSRCSVTVLDPPPATNQLTLVHDTDRRSA